MPTTLISDIPDTVLEVYSRDAILAALPLLVFRSFVELKSQLGDESGETIKFLKYDNMTKGGKLGSETTPIPKRKLSESQVEFSTDEYGNAYQVSRRALTGSFRSLMDDMAVLLGRDYAVVLDEAIRDIFLASATVQYAGGVGSSGAILLASTMKTVEIKDMVETLKTLNVPPRIRGGDQHYVCIASPKQLRGLRDDDGWLKPHQYVDTANIYNGEVGKYEGCVFIETTQTDILAGAGDSGQDIHRAIVFGSDAVGFSEPEPFQIVNDGVEDFGRLLSLGWYSIFGGGIINDHIGIIETS